MTTSRSPKQAQRPSLPLLAATTAALPAVVLSSLAAAMKAQAATAAASGVIPEAAVSSSLPTAFRQQSTPAEYTVVRGDTISSIAGRHGLNTRDVLQLNNLQANTLIYPGQKI